MSKRIDVFDIETLASCWTYSGLDIETGICSQFVLHVDRWDFEPLVKHLRSLYGGIGYNNINFDYPVIHYLLSNVNTLRNQSRLSVIKLLFNKAQEIIDKQNSFNDFTATVAIKPKDCYFKQLDLFKIWHFNNAARRQSLKGLEINMNYPNVMDMPIDYTREDIRFDEIDGILEYNLNDVKATFEFYKRSIDKINLRKGLITKYGIPCLNYPDSKIGEQLVLKLYCEATGMNMWDVKQMRSERLEIALKDCIFDYIYFTTPEFNKSLDHFKSYIISREDVAEKDKKKKKKLGSCIFKGFKYDFGLGGIHGCIKSGIYESDEEYIIIDADVKCGVLTH